MRMVGIQQTTDVNYPYWSVAELMPRNEMEKLQFRRLAEQVNFLWEKSPFYKQKWQESGFSPDKLKTLQDIRLIPLLDKLEIRSSQEMNPPYGIMYIPNDDPIIRIAMTSGTTGEPVRIPFTEKDYFGVFCEGAMRVLLSAGVTKDDIVHVAFGFLPFIGLAGMHDACEHLLGCMVVPGGAWSSAIRLKMIKTLNVTVLMGTPTYLLHLAGVAEEIGVDTTKLGLRLIMSTGESGAASIPNTGVRLEKAYNCKVHDFAGTQETNFIFGTCKYDTPHLYEDLLYFEVLDPDTYEPVKPGEEGVLVVTDLVQKTHPMIRFKTGDLVSGIDYDHKCSCGRTSARFKGFKGRTGDIIKVKGVCISVSGIENVIRGIDNCSDNYEYMAVRDGEKDKITVRIEPVKELDPSKWEELRVNVAEILYGSFMINMDVEIVEPGTLPVFELKAKRFRDLRESTV